MPNKHAVLAAHLTDLLPSRIRARVLEEGALSAKYGPLSRTLMTAGEIGSFDREQLFHTIRRSYSTGTRQEIQDIRGKAFLVKADNRQVVLGTLAGSEFQQLARINSLIILSPDHTDRTRALNRLLDQLGPTTPGFDSLKASIIEKELSDTEAGDLLEEQSIGVEARRARIIAAHNAPTITLNDIVPDNLSYYERLCGPVPHEVSTDEYLSTVLPSYRQRLLKRNICRGLELALFGALRDDLSPLEWVKLVGDEELWEALTEIELRGNPFALLGALDIALARQHDKRFMNFANDTMSLLLQEQIARPDGVDAYELLPLFAQLVLDRISVAEGGTSCPPFWRRMCAWMHAGILMQSTLGVEIKLDVFRDWVDANKTLAGTYAQMVDLQREPMYRAGQICKEYLREEVIGRLAILGFRQKAAGRKVPRIEEIGKAVEQVVANGSPFGCWMPGPLDGHLEPSKQKDRSLSDADIAAIIEELGHDSSRIIWSKLAYYSQYLGLGLEVLAKARESCVNVPLNVDPPITGPDPRRLFDLGLVAAAHRDKDLARTIFEKTLDMASHTKTREGVMCLIHSLLLANAAFESESEYASWLKEQLTNLAIRLPSGECTELLLEHLSEIKKVLPLNWQVCSSAQAIALAAQ